ncbi:MAG: DEAD/DEAH box helicase [Bacteroidales bacterium]|nr:DEAD/DEAH box helicase [Bacteroidales bacterium]
MEETDNQNNPPTESEAVTKSLAFDDCTQGIFGTYADYTRVDTTNKIVSSNNSTISSLTASRTMFQTYQFKPLVKFLNSPNRRMLVADEVGLGKTIEAGYIMQELRARGELGNVLLVSPKSLQPKWQKEMRDKFALEFKIYAKISDLFLDLDRNDGHVRAIINYERIRRRKDYDSKHEYDTDAPVNLVDYLVGHKTRFSLVVCDEAHRMRNGNTLTYKGAEIVMSRADAAVFLTATPMMTGTGDYYNLLHLLDPDRFEDYNAFLNLLMETRPFIVAATKVNNKTPFSEIIEWLESYEVKVLYRDESASISLSKTETISQIYSGNPLYDEIIKLLDGSDTPATRATILKRLESISQTNDIFTRTRKREVNTSTTKPERKAHIVEVIPTAEETLLEKEVIGKYLKENLSPTKFVPSANLMAQLEALSPGQRMGLMQIRRQLASSVHAYLSTEDDLEKGVDAFVASVDSKVDCLVELIEGRVKTGGQRKVVVFAIFRKTLEYLRIRLRRQGYNCLIVHGGVDNRDEVIGQFRKNPNIHVLLASEVAGEGLDLEFCSSIVNFDLPWNPMVVEQRIGRLDRFGQKAPIVHIYNMVMRGSIQEHIYSRLFQRIGMFEWNIGELEEILDMPLSSYYSLRFAALQQYEDQYYRGELTDEDVLRKIGEVAIACESRQQGARLLNEDLEETLTYDSYCCDKINQILTGRSSLGSEQLRMYLEDVLTVAIPGSILEDREDGTCRIHLPMGRSTALVDFLLDNQPAGDDNVKMFSDFISDIKRKYPVTLTFDQEVAFANRDLVFVNMFHPLIAACVSYNERTGKTRQETFSFSLPYGPVRGDYFLAQYEIVTKRDVHGVTKTSTELFPVLYDAQVGVVIPDQKVAEDFYRWTQGVAQDRKADERFLAADVLAQMRSDLEEYVGNEAETRRLELVSASQAAAERRTARTREYYEAIIHNRQRAIDLWEHVIKHNWFLTLKERRCLLGAIHVTLENIRDAQTEMEERMALITPGEVQVETRLLLLSLIHVDDTIENRP